MNNQGEKIERFKRFRLKSCRSISLPVKNMASGAPRGHITTGIFSTDKVMVIFRSLKTIEFTTAQFNGRFWTLEIFQNIKLNLELSVYCEGTQQNYKGLERTTTAQTQR